MASSFAIPDLSVARGNLIKTAWDRLSPLPGGTRLFSRLVGRAAPYTGSIRAHVEVLRRGHAEVAMKDRRGVRNHLTSIHAVALVNLAELAGNIALTYSLPEDARFIVAGLEITYVKKARGTVRAVCDCPVPDTCARAEYLVPVSIRDRDGDEVARATLRSLVGPKPAAS